MHYCASALDSIAKGISHGASHTSPFILCPCSAYLRIYKRKYVHVRASIRELVDSGMAYYTFFKPRNFRF